MKYLQALKEKNLSVDQLANKAKDQVAQLMQYEKDIAFIKENASDPDSEEFKNDMAAIEEKVKILDEKVYSYILKFDLAKYNERKQMMFEMTEKRKQAKNKATSGTVSGSAANTASVTNHVQPTSQPEVKPASAPVETKIEEVAPQAPVVEIKQEQIAQPEITINDMSEADRARLYIEEEFQPVQKVKTKSNGVYFACIGIGALLLTFGAVNVFKQKK